MHRESNQSVIDRLIHFAIWLCIMGLITSAATAALLLCYTGLYQLCLKNTFTATMRILPGILLGLASYWMARSGNDLIDR